MKKLPDLFFLVLVSFGLAFWGIDLPAVLAQEAQRVALVVQFDNEKILTRCIETNGKELTGQDVLQLAGLDLDLYYDANQDVAVCKVNGQGCEASACFCQFPDYWSYWHMHVEEWVYSGRGSSSSMVQAGSVEGWRWGDGAPPSKISYEQICTADSSAASLKDANIAQVADVAGLASVAEPALTHPSTLAYGTIGYLFFGLTLVIMGFGLIFMLKVSHS